MANPAVTLPPGLFIYSCIGFSGFSASKNKSCETTSDAVTSFTSSDNFTNFKNWFDGDNIAAALSAQAETNGTGTSGPNYDQTGTYPIVACDHSILSTTITIDVSEKTSETAATPPVISDASLADDAEMTISILTVGSTIPGAGLIATLKGYKT